MQYNEFIHIAKDRFGAESADEVLTISRAVLHTLVDHMAGNAADNLGAQLPAELLHIIREVAPEDRDQGERFDLAEFYQRVAKRAGVDDAMGQTYTQVFMDILSKMITDGELVKLQKMLPDEYSVLFDGVPGPSSAA